jgi:hypothetical protein
MPGATDRQLIDRARAEGRIVITSDKGYGELAYRRRLVPPGVVLLRVVLRSPEYIQQRLELLLASPAVLVGPPIVLTDAGTRSLPLPKVWSTSRSPSLFAT